MYHIKFISCKCVMCGVYSSIGLLGWDWMEIWNMNGCTTKCIQNVHKLSIIDLLTYHELFSLLPKAAKRQWLLDYFHMNTSRGMSITNYSICGQSVCKLGWINTLGLSQSYYYKVFSLFKSGVRKANIEVCLSNN